MPNIFQRALKRAGEFLERIVGPTPEAVPPPPPPPPPPPAPPTGGGFFDETPEERAKDEPQYPGEEPTITRRQIHDIDFSERDGRILPRWEVGSEDSPPTIGDIEALMRDADSGRTDFTYTFIIIGVVRIDSPRRRRETTLALDETVIRGYRKTVNNSWFYLVNSDSVEDYFNQLLRIDDVEWDRIDSVQILDKRTSPPPEEP